MPRQPAQGQGLTIPPALPEPALVDRALFESPLLLGGPLVVCAIVAVFLLNARAKLLRGLATGGLLLALAAGVFVLTSVVTTPREAVVAQTRRLVDAVGGAHMTDVDALLSDDPEVRYRGFAAPSRAALLLAIAATMGPRGEGELKSWRIAEMQATIDGPRVARSQVLVRATHKATALPASAWVLMHWERASDGRWRCFAIEPLDIR